jgi:hypothetical protein
MNNNFVKAAGICSIIFVVFFVFSFILYSAAGVEREDPEKIEVYLQNVHNNTLYAGGYWVFVTGFLLLIPIFLGFYQALREGGGILWVALAASLMGVTLFLASTTISLGIVRQLASGYAEAGVSDKSVLEVMAKTLMEALIWANSIGLFLSFGIGVLLVSIGVLRTNVIGHWLGWVGVVIGGLEVIVNPLDPVLGTSSLFFNIMLSVGFILTLVWFLIIGAFLLRVREAAYD